MNLGELADHRGVVRPGDRAQCQSSVQDAIGEISKGSQLVAGYSRRLDGGIGKSGEFLGPGESSARGERSHPVVDGGRSLARKLLVDDGAGQGMKVAVRTAIAGEAGIWIHTPHRPAQGGIPAGKGPEGGG